MNFSHISKFLSFFCFVLLASGSLSGQNVPIDFEANGHGANWTWTVFENSVNPPLEIISNPYPGGINSSATVAKFTALQAGAPFAGCESLHGSDIGTFTIDSSNMIIKIMVWKSVISNVGIKLVRVDNWSLGEILIPNTTVNQWEQITFDFSSHLGLTYDQIVIFPDFNARSSDNIIYFDNVFGPDAVATSLEAPQQFALDIYPNPSHSRCSIRSSRPMEAVEVFNALGERVLLSKEYGTDLSFDLENMPNGVYLVRATVEGRHVHKKLIKN